jgi:CheY-like chemotaxis protein/Tfp pilus assembly protein PilZ
MSEKKQVLIICRTTAGQMYLGVLLNRIWYSPVLAKTPEEGISIAQKTSCAMVLFDGDVAELELRPAVTRLRTDPATNDLPLVLFMTNDNPSLSQSLLSLGCAAILTKPLDLAIVYGVLARLSGQPRHTPRIPVKMNVEIAEGTPERTLPCVNISEGGLYLRTPNPLAGGAILHIRFTLPHDTGSIELTAEVVRTLTLGVQLEAEPGMGLRFQDISQGTLLRLRNFVQWQMIGDLEWNSNI